MNLLLDHICLFVFNKKTKKESFIENVNGTSNIKEYTAIVDNKCVCLGNTEEYLYETIDDKQININNKEYVKVLVDLLSIHQYILRSKYKMYMHTKNNANKKHDNSTIKKSDINNTAKRSIKHNNTNKKITIDNSVIKKSDMNNIAKKSIKHNNTNKKINNVNKKVISDNNANKKINNNNANKKNN